jgi:hypothetical protein
MVSPPRVVEVELGVQPAEGFAPGVERDVAVDVHGHFDGAVADDLQDDPGMDPEGEQQAHAGVPEVVQPDAADPCAAVSWSKARETLRGSSRPPTVEVNR